MKKLFLVGALALFGATMNAQEGNFKIGAHVGLPMGDAADSFSLNAGIDLAYTWRVADSFDLGLTTGYSHYMLKSEIKDFYDAMGVDAPSFGLIPIAATAQYNIDGGMFVGADLGYALWTEEGADGGFYYQPKVGYSFNEQNDLYVGYKGISQDGGSISSINLGYAYKF